MASIQLHRGKWRAQVSIGGRRESKVLPTRKAAAAWALAREAELGGRRLPDQSLKSALERYAREVSPTHRGEHWEVVRLLAFTREPIAMRRLAGLTAADLSQWRDERLARRKPATVLREMNLLHGVFECCRRDWGWLRENPLRDVRRPAQPRGRARRVSDAEVDAVARAFGVHDALRGETATQRVGLAFLLALETAMRSGEMLGLRAEDVRLDRRFVVLTQTKNGDRREVPLSSRAVAILRALPEVPAGQPVFALDAGVRDALWRRYRPAHLGDLHFHDTRSEAIWRLSKKLDVLQLARVIGHRDPRSLLIYYRESAADMARLLD